MACVGPPVPRCMGCSLRRSPPVSILGPPSTYLSTRCIHSFRVSLVQGKGRSTPQRFRAKVRSLAAWVAMVTSSHFCHTQDRNRELGTQKQVLSTHQVATWGDLAVEGPDCPLACFASQPLVTLSLCFQFLFFSEQELLRDLDAEGGQSPPCQLIAPYPWLPLPPAKGQPGCRAASQPHSARYFELSLRSWRALHLNADFVPSKVHDLPQWSPSPISKR